MSYLEMGGGNESFHLAIQYTTQTDETTDESDTDNNAWGVLAEHSIGDFTLSTAYNRVSGEVSNGFGGGPYFTSTEDHTLDGVTDEKAVMLGFEYSGFDSLTLALVGTDFEQSEDEVDAIISYAFNQSIHADIIYSDMSDDGKMTKVFLNYDF
jgi:predicted porin